MQLWSYGFCQESELRGLAVYYITLQLCNEIVGVRCTLNVQGEDLMQITFLGVGNRADR